MAPRLIATLATAALGLTVLTCAAPAPKPPPPVAPICDLSDAEVHDACQSSVRDVTSDEPPVFAFKSLLLGTPDSDVEQALGETWACEHQQASWTCTRRGTTFPKEIGLLFNESRLESIQVPLPCAAGAKGVVCEQYASYVRELRRHLGAPATQVDGLCSEADAGQQPKKTFASWKHGLSRLCLVVRGSLKGPAGGAVDLTLETESVETQCKTDRRE